MIPFRLPFSARSNRFVLLLGHIDPLGQIAPPFSRRRVFANHSNQICHGIKVGFNEAAATGYLARKSILKPTA